MRIGSRNQRLSKSRGHCRGTAVWIKPSFMEMALFNRVEAIDFVEQTPTDRAAEDVKWMRRDCKNGSPSPCAQLAKVGKSFQAGDFGRGDIKHNHVRAFQPHFSSRNQQDSHCGSIGKDFRAVEHGIVQSDG